MADYEGDLFITSDRFRKALLNSERAAASEMVRVYGNIWKEINTQIREIGQNYYANQAAGIATDQAWLQQLGRLKLLRKQVESELARFAKYAEDKVISEQEAAVKSAQEHAEKLIRARLGLPLQGPAILPGEVRLVFNRLPAQSIKELIGFMQDGSPLKELFDGLPNDGGKIVEEGLIQGLALGLSPAQIAINIRKGLGGNLARALTIARTEVLRSYREASRLTYKENEDVVAGWIWRSARNTRTCACCWAMDGTEHSLDERLDDHPNGRCLTPGTVVSGPIATAFVSRYYEGDIVTIQTSSGKFLSVTPNHPILTSRGWVAADSIVEGDNVVCYSGDEWRSSGMCPDDYQVPTAVENIPGSLNLTRLITMPTSPKDFHGDGVGSNIHVIYTNRFLGICSKTSFAEPFFEEYFCRGLSNRPFFSSHCPSEFFFKWDNSTSYSVLGDFDPFTVFFNRNILGKQFIRLGLVSEADIISNQSSSDCTSRYAEGFSEGILRFSRQVSSDNFVFRNVEFISPGFTGFFPDDTITSAFVSEQVMSLEKISQALFRSVEYGSSILRAITRNVSLDRVLEISITRFSGHVYNLQTPVGWYIANGVITHNCTMIPKTATWAEIGKRYGIDLSDIPDTNPEIKSGTALFEKLPAEKQIKIFGPAKYAAWKDGQFTLSDIVGRKRSREWGTHRYERSLQDLIGEKAKEYTRLARMGMAQRAGNYTVDDLVHIAGIGLRKLTPGELDRVVRHVANAGFSSTEMMRVRMPIRGQFWNGKWLGTDDRIPTDVGHYLKHVVVNQEWPDGTTLKDYKRSLREVILDPASDIFVSKYNDAWQIGFIRESREWQGLRGKDFILVEYKVQYGYWTTGFQPQNLSRQVFEGRESIVWLRNRILK
ncbi:hypothetical protein ADN00_18870 [Ornatilinea apprima]|uniref:Hint domain-containing protein n=1 Tax=Ornatilinea apprima TaxID=1134406 RepID=A0A0N8GKM4_9CHLR|nr:phage minor head protein [Ornatilinea apprima]KPL70106.1 hypothetical protein ADN00_18870 [Ornatilinea apprima]